MSDKYTVPEQDKKNDENNPEKNNHNHHDNDHRKTPGQVIHPRPTHGEPAVRGQLVKNVDAMFREFPEFTYQEGLSDSGILGTWRGKVQPIQNLDEVMLLLDDLAHNRAVYRVRDNLQHLPECKEKHCEHAWMNANLDLTKQFDLRITYSGNEALPKCYVLAPLIPQEKRKHMWADGAICAFLASEGIWQWRAHTVTDFLPHVFVWLIKWVVFDATGVWIGAQHDSSPLYHLRIVDRDDPCWCGSGRLYRKCHRIQDQIDAGLAPPKRLLRPAAIQNIRWFRRH